MYRLVLNILDTYGRKFINLMVTHMGEASGVVKGIQHPTNDQETILFNNILSPGILNLQLN